MSSIINLRLVPQEEEPRREVITHTQPETLDFASALIVNREQLREAYLDTRYASHFLHNVSDPAEIDIAELAYLCRTLHHAAQILSDMLDPKGGAR